WSKATSKAIMSRGRRWIPCPGRAGPGPRCPSCTPGRAWCRSCWTACPATRCASIHRNWRACPTIGCGPGDSGEFYIPDDPREADGLDVGALVKEMWRDWAWMGDDDPELAEMRGPFTLEWPGLAPPGDAPLTPAERQRALDVVLPRIRGHRRPEPEARIGLVAADRPADVLAVVGWDALVPRAE